MSIAAALSSIDGDPKVRFSLRKVMVNLFHVSESTVSRMLADPESRMEIAQIAELARYLDDEYDERRLADCFHGARSSLWPKLDRFINGRLDDDVMQLQEAIGDVIRCYREKDKAPGKVAWHRASEALANMLGELEGL
jgi:hypothetical protein